MGPGTPARSQVQLDVSVGYRRHRWRNSMADRKWKMLSDIWRLPTGEFAAWEQLPFVHVAFQHQADYCEQIRQKRRRSVIDE
jgi:hypothetical protein